MRYLFISLICLLAVNIHAQEPDALPRGLASHELALINSGEYVKNISNRSPESPEGPIRTMAEWEELQGVVITWRAYKSILAQIVEALNDHTQVFIVCSDSVAVQIYLDNAGVAYDTNVSFHEIPSR